MKLASQHCSLLQSTGPDARQLELSVKWNHLKNINKCESKIDDDDDDDNRLCLGLSYSEYCDNFIKVQQNNYTVCYLA